jgi:hypothetical protein
MTSSSLYSGIPRGVVWRVQTPSKILNFWQSCAEFPVPWKIHPQQPNMNMGFTHLQIEQNPWLGAYRPQSPFSLPCPQMNLLNPPWTKFLGMPLSLYNHFSVTHWFSDKLFDFPFVFLCTGSLHATSLGWLSMQAPPYACWSHVWLCEAGISSLPRNSITAHCQNNMSLPTICLHWNMPMWHDFHSGTRKPTEVIDTY